MSLLTELLNTFGTRGMGELASALGEPHESVENGMQTALATVLGGVANQAGHPGMLQKILEMAPSGMAEAGPARVASAMMDPSSPLMSVGKGILSMLFGGSEGRINQALGSSTGLPTGTISSLLAMAAPVVASFLGNKVRAEGMSATGLATLLQREAPGIRAALPSGVSSLLGGEVRTVPRVAVTAPAQTTSVGRWILPLALLALIPAIWLLSHARKPVVETPPAPAGTANRSVPDIPLTAPSLPGKLDLHFATNSMQLQRGSQSELQDFAGAMAENRTASISVNGYTDSSGQNAANLRLSQQRADAVKADLVRLGVSPDRITARGFGEQDPIADNATADGRESNRRVTVEINDR